MKAQNKYNENSQRCIRGMKFQYRVLNELKEASFEVDEVRKQFSKKYPKLTKYQLNNLEQRFGDVVMLFNGRLVFIECVNIGTEFTSPFPEHKIKKFQGSEKWYAIGWKGYKTKFIHSSTMNAYAKKLPSFEREGKKFRDLRRWNIKNIKKSISGASEFMKFLKNEKCK
jgi:hypothetical protein